jgi:hypothetical protein
MKDKLALIVASVAVVIAIGGYVYPKADGLVGASGTRFPNGVSADTTSPVAGELRGATLNLTGDGAVSGGTLNVVTSNTATSTVIGGCFEFYATSTATAHKFQASTTPGIMYSQYGACPRL